MVVELLSVGTELLMGSIVNTNAQFLAERCARLGVSVFCQTVVGDNPGRLREAVDTAVSRSDMVILTGGLGPTEDDLTKEICAQAFGWPLVEDGHTRERIQGFFKNSIYKVIPENNWKQAMIPQGALVLDNDNGTAPGLIMEKDGKRLILLPGPPNEMIPLFNNQVEPYLRKLRPGFLVTRMVKVCGVGESQVEDMLLDLIDGQSNPTIATYAKTGEVHVRVTASASDEETGDKLIKPVVKEIKKRLGRAVYSVREEETLEMTLVRLLKKHELTVATAESCTGGLVASRIVNVSGASDVFKEGFVTYSNKAKRKHLDVSKGTLKKYGAVSSQTAREMAIGGAFATDSDVCVSVTGIAGPDGGTEEKPVGLVYMACCFKDKVTVEKYQFKGNRDKVREHAAVRALDLVRRTVLENCE
ncbi:MAG: competence/damage-inducible protein A [Hungatella sp.]|nr:competence/damage-inducible protein A [Hungatella sp.]